MDFDELDDLERIPSCQTLRGPDLLKTLPPRTKVFEVSSSESESSEISGPFSDVVYSVEFESKRKAKELFGKDLYAAFSFSPEFKSAVEQVKKEMIRDNPDYLKTESMIAENLEQIKSGSLLTVPQAETRSKLNYKFLQFPRIDYDVEKTDKEELDGKKDKEVVKEKKKKVKATKQDDEETVFDTMSGYWRLLSVYDQFRISPPWYDAYAEGKRHWLETDPIPREVFEQSRKKCLTWLNKYFDN